MSAPANQRPEWGGLTNERPPRGLQVLAPGSVILDTNIYTTTVNQTLHHTRDCLSLQIQFLNKIETRNLAFDYVKLKE